MLVVCYSQKKRLDTEQKKRERNRMTMTRENLNKFIIYPILYKPNGTYVFTQGKKTFDKGAYSVYQH